SRGGVMPKMVIEVPDELTEVGKAMAEHLANLQRTMARLGGGKAVDYAEVEVAMAESAGRVPEPPTTLPMTDPAPVGGGLRVDQYLGHEYGRRWESEQPKEEVHSTPLS